MHFVEIQEEKKVGNACCMHFVEIQEEKKVGKSNHGYCSWNKTILIVSIK